MSVQQPGEASARRALPAAAATPAGSGGGGFRDLLRAVAVPRQTEAGASGVEAYVIAPGDTLSEIARRQLVEHGRPVTGSSITQEVERLARDNQIADPDKIYAGATLRLGTPAGGESTVVDAGTLRFAQAGAARPANSGSGLPRSTQVFAPAASFRYPGTDRLQPVSGQRMAGSAASFPQLDRTLDRAVDQGYLPVAERQPVHDRIVELSRKYQFSPDDFATVALMESDGLNPKATNGRCHGIIQFCEGPNRGAASVGMQGRAADIAGMSTLQQLDLVDKYFEDTRLGETGAVSLVDLYLTILTPAARAERRADVPLGIGGRQAKVLHPQGDHAQPITRSSLLSGLMTHARGRLEPLGRLFGAQSPPVAPALAQRPLDGAVTQGEVRDARVAPSPDTGMRPADRRGRQG